MTEQQTECRRCGVCCAKGGPALHTGDLEYIRSGKLPISRLITIRRGELVDHPLTGRVQPTECELVKIAGTGRNWRCVFFSDERGCTVYPYRPRACRVLRCWDDTEISELIGRQTLSRLDILTSEDPLRPLVAEHERLCPCPDMEAIRNGLPDLPAGLVQTLQDSVNADLRFRARVIREHNLDLAQELFYFGRPLFQLLGAIGLGITETAAGIRLSVGGPRQ